MYKCVYICGEDEYLAQNMCEGRRDNLLELVMSFCHVCSGDEIQVISLGPKYLHPLSHLTMSFVGVYGLCVGKVCLFVYLSIYMYIYQIYMMCVY